MSNLTLILGGARSGKSRHAQQMAEEAGGANPIVYIATALTGDEEMAERIARHRDDRPGDWRTVEEPWDAPAAIRGSQDAGAILVDCFTMYLTNHLLRTPGGLTDSAPPVWDAKAAEQAGRDLIDAAVRSAVPVLLVSNEVGLGLVPETPLGRVFRDVAGRANQWAAAEARRVVFMVSGLPMAVK